MSLITKTQRLEILNLGTTDIDLLYNLTGDKDVMRFFPKVLSYDETKEMMLKILDHYEKYGYCLWKTILNSNGKFVGIAGLLHQEIDGEVETEISYRILPELWNNGYATEAAQACKEYAENILRKKKLISIIHPMNIASKRIAQKLGGKKEKSVIFMGEEHEIYVY
jgi:RimJ/RimL family protein N-acetyltransferase